MNWRPRASASGPGVAADPAASSATSPPEKAAPAHQHGDEQQAVIAAMLLVVIVPLWINSDRIDKTAVRRSEVQAVADRWANDAGWSVTGVTAACNQVLIEATGPNPVLGLTLLRNDLDAAGLYGLDVRVSLVPASYQPLPKQASVCVVGEPGESTKAGQSPAAP